MKAGDKQSLFGLFFYPEDGGDMFLRNVFISQTIVVFIMTAERSIKPNMIVRTTRRLSE
jgi:hypothetical protein